MILNAHTYYSLRYGTLSIEEVVQAALDNNYEAIAITDINNSSGVLEFVKVCFEKCIKPIVGMEFRNGDDLEFIAIAKNNDGFKEINELMTACNISSTPIPKRAEFHNCYIIYPYSKATTEELKENEFIGIRSNQINKILFDSEKQKSKYVILQSLTYDNQKGFDVHQKLCAVGHNLLLSQLKPENTAGNDEHPIPRKLLLKKFEELPQLIKNTKIIVENCSFNFDFKSNKNKKTFTGNKNDDTLLLQKLAYDGLTFRYGANNKIAKQRVDNELAIINNLDFSAYFLITWDIVRYSMSRGYYHVGRGSGANSVVAYCLRITDVCPIELDLYFERFLNPKRKSPPDFDIDYSWKERDDVIDYIFKRYGRKHTALLGTMSTFKDRSILRELGKIYGLPKEDIDRLIKDPNSALNENEICKTILSYYSEIENYPNTRSIHAGGILISEEPLTAYCALDMPPKGFPTTQFDMYLAEDIGLDKLDVLSQRGIGHIKEAAEIIKQNKGISIDVHDINKFKTDKKVQAQLLSGNTIGCFYVESPAMRGLLKKLNCDNYLTLVAASSIIRPGVARSGMMKAYIQRSHNPESFEYLHPVMKEQLKDTFGVMVYQEDVLKVGHYFGGLDLADADVLRRMMSGKSRNKKHLEEIEAKFFNHCKEQKYPEHISNEVWRQIESFAGYSFSKAHSASYAVESYQSLYLKSYFPMEFMVAVINNFGGFYNTRIYVNEAQMSGAEVHLPCVNKSTYTTNIHGKDIHLGFIHLKSLEEKIGQTIESERNKNGNYTSLDDFLKRIQIGIEQLIILIRINAFRFTKKNKRQLLWEAHLLMGQNQTKHSSMLFEPPKSDFTLPPLEYNKIEDAYDEIELLGFTTTLNPFDLLKTASRESLRAKELIHFTGKQIRIMGNYVTYKPVRTINGDQMAFGTFLDMDGCFFDTVNFPPSLKKFPFTGSGVYLISGKVVEEFGFPSIEVEKMARLPIQPDPRN